MPVIDTYKGYDIWFNPDVRLYLAIRDNDICFHSVSIEGLKNQIDNFTSDSKENSKK